MRKQKEKQVLCVLKKCTCCNLEFPKTEEYFFRKNQKKKLASGKIAIYNVFTAICKKCHNNKSVENRIINRCKEEGIKRHEWDDFKRKQLMSREIFKLKDERLKGIPRPTRARILRKIRNENYCFTTIENYYKECSENISKAQRKYNYNTNGKLNSKTITDEMPDYYIANRLKIPINELPKEIIETKRLLLKIKRELKNN